MTKVDLLSNPKQRREFCKAMHSLFKCRTSTLSPELSNCEISCPFKAAEDVERWVGAEGITIRAAVERWAVKTISEPMKFTALADGLGMKVEDLKELIAVVRRAHE